MSWWNRLFGGRPLQEPFTLTEEGIERRLASGQLESVRWVDVSRVEIMTSDAGPWVEDCHWVLWGADGAEGSARGVVVPNGRVTELGLLDWLGRLPGFAANEAAVSRAIIVAMGSTENAVFPVWSRSDGE